MIVKPLTTYTILKIPEELLRQMENERSTTSMATSAPDTAPIPVPPSTPLSVARPIRAPVTAPRRTPTESEREMLRKKNYNSPMQSERINVER